MASQIDLLHWITDNITLLQLKATHYTWTERFLPQYTDLQVSITLGGKEYCGRGTAKNENISFLKATAEAIERALMTSSNLKTSNGMAAHSSPELASTAAKLELAERDWFLAHYLIKSPFQAINASSFLETNLINSISSFEAIGIEFQFSASDLGREYAVATCVAFGNNAKIAFGCFTGLGCNLTKSAAIESALIECLRDLVAFLDGMDKQISQPISLEQFLELEIVRPENHRALAMNLQYGAMLRCMFVPSENPDSGMCRLSDISTEEMRIPLTVFPELSGAPLHVFKAKSAMVQDLFFGSITLSIVNLERLSKLYSGTLAWENIQKIPHPLS